MNASVRNEKYISTSLFLKRMSGGSSAWQSFRISLIQADGDAVDFAPKGEAAQPAERTETGVSQESCRDSSALRVQNRTAYPAS